MTETRHAPIGFDFRPENWMESAECINHDPNWWHSEVLGRRQDEHEAAKRICGECPVRLQCLEYAMETETSSWSRYGIWGGLTPDERRALAKEAS